MTQREQSDWRVQRAPMDAPTGYPWRVLHPDVVRSFATQGEAFEYAMRRADKCTVCGSCAHDHGGWSHAYTRAKRARARTEDVSTLTQAPGTVRAVTDVLLPHGCGVCAGMIAGWCGTCGRLCTPELDAASVTVQVPHHPAAARYADLVRLYNELVTPHGLAPMDPARILGAEREPLAFTDSGDVT